MNEIKESEDSLKVVAVVIVIDVRFLLSFDLS